jgi:hypothetical protein
MKRVKVNITIDTENELTDEQVYQAMFDFKYRMEGYHTDGLDFLKGADIGFKKDFERSEITTLP